VPFVALGSLAALAGDHGPIILPKAKRVVSSRDPLHLVMIVSCNVAIALLMIERHGSQTVQLLAQLLYHGFELCILLPTPAALLLDCLDLFPLP
jgi:hypothetical protein